jgi:hypothetical protein
VEAALRPDVSGYRTGVRAFRHTVLLVEGGQVQVSDSRSSAMVGKVSGLVEFLRRVAQMGMTPVRQVRDYPYVLWIDDLPAEIVLDRAAVTGQPLASFPPVPFEPHPPLPALLAGRVEPAQLNDASSEVAPLQPLASLQAMWEQLAGQDADGGDSTPSEADVQKAYAQWSQQWRDWAHHERQVAPARAWHEKLSDAYRDLERSGDQWELVLATGLLA